MSYRMLKQGPGARFNINMPSCSYRNYQTVSPLLSLWWGSYLYGENYYVLERRFWFILRHGPVRERHLRMPKLSSYPGYFREPHWMSWGSRKYPGSFDGSGKRWRTKTFKNKQQAGDTQLSEPMMTPLHQLVLGRQEKIISIRFRGLLAQS